MSCGAERGVGNHLRRRKKYLSVPGGRKRSQYSQNRGPGGCSAEFGEFWERISMFSLPRTSRSTPHVDVAWVYEGWSPLATSAEGVAAAPARG